MTHGAPRIPAWVALVWVGVAFGASLCGIGGGLIAVPLLHYGARLPLRTAVGTGLVLVCTLGLSATVAEALRAHSQLLPEVAGLLIVGALLGAQLGFRVAQRVDPLALKVVFVLALVLAGLRVLTASAGGGPAPGGLTAAELALVPAVGFAGGFLAPLLGIGGGLVVVPALFLGFPTIGYIEARASSLAMAVVASGWSVRNYLRSGEVSLRTAAPLIAATVVGSVLGVQAVHLPGWAERARLLLGVVLLLVALRFAHDLLAAWRLRRADA